MEAAHPHRTASSRAAIAILARPSESTQRRLTSSVKVPKSSGSSTITPVVPLEIREGTPPAFTPTTGTPDAIDSRTTKPRVSESEGITNTSALAKASESICPLRGPVKTVGVSAKNSLNSSPCGPLPTMASLAFTPLSRRFIRTAFSSFSLFSAPSLPTYRRRGPSSASPSFKPRSLLLMASDLKRGSNTSTSTPFCHTSTLFTPRSTSCCFS
mmetsp:Transcript_31739/g.62844  ORF Transcript_31739/g.62844 Transcript_31739/m.62844 type:complete len:213 (+) Transcript_31739:1171-1809(+)